MREFSRVPLAFLFVVLFNLNGLAQSSTITTYAGSSLPAVGAVAINRAIGASYSVIPDAADGFYFAAGSLVYRAAVDGTLVVVAGTTQGFSGDGGPASSAQFWGNLSLAMDVAGNLFIADQGTNRVRKVTPAGVISTVAGIGIPGFGGDNGPATAARLNEPSAVAVDSSGNIFIADTRNHRIRKVDPAGVITTVAGNGSLGFSGDGGPAASAQLNGPSGVALDGLGNLFIADTFNSRIRRVTSAGNITTVVGSGAPGFGGFGGDGGPATSALVSLPSGIAVDTARSLLIADVGNQRIRKVTTEGIISTVAGTDSFGFSGDGGLAVLAQLNRPASVTADAIGNLFIADTNNLRIRKVTADGFITTVAGNGTTSFSGDGGRAVHAQLNFPFSAALDGAGNLFIADTENHRVRRVTPAGVITTLAGTGIGGFGGDGGPAISARLNGPSGVAVDATGSVFISDTNNSRIRKVMADGIITTVAGLDNSFVFGPKFGGDGGPATSARLDTPLGIAFDRTGNLFIVDALNARIRKINAAGIISTVAGNGIGGFGGDGGPATSASIYGPVAVAVDGSGNFFIADSSLNRIRKVTADGIISTVAGTGTNINTGGFSGDGGPATAAEITSPSGVAVDGQGNLFIADTSNNRVRRVTPDGIINTVAGNGSAGFGGDGGPATSAQLLHPSGIVTDGSNTLFIVDRINGRIRKVVFPVIPFTIANRGGISLLSSGNSASIETGYGRIQPAAGGTTPVGVAIFGARTNGILVSETSVPATRALNAGRIYAEITDVVNTGLAIVNPNNSAASVSFFFTDGAGTDLGSASTTIPANGQIAKFLNESPFNTLTTNTFQGAFSFTSTLPLGVVALRSYINEHGDFLMSTLPVINTSIAAGTGTTVVPHFVNGGGWVTQILLVNPTDTAMGGSIQFTNDIGAATDVTIGSDTRSRFTYSIPGRTSQKLATVGSAQLITSGAVRIVPAGSGSAVPTALVIFSYKPLGVVVSETGVPSLSGTAFRMYAESSGIDGQPGNIQTGVAIANNTSTTATVIFELTNLDGTTTGLPASASASLPASGHIGKFLAEIFTTLPNPFKGILRISTTSSEVSVVGLRARYNERPSPENFLITTMPPTSETDAAISTELFFPQLAEGGGYTTQFILFNGTAGQQSSGSLFLFQPSGQTLGVTLR